METVQRVRFQLNGREELLRIRDVNARMAVLFWGVSVLSTKGCWRSLSQHNINMVMFKSLLISIVYDFQLLIHSTDTH